MHSLLNKIKTQILSFSVKDYFLTYTDQHRRFLIYLFITIIAYQSVSIFYKVMGLSLIKATMPAMGLVDESAGLLKEKAVSKQGPEFYQVILDRNLFRTTDKTLAEKENEQQGNGANVQSISALYLLKGTVAGGSKYGFAIIEEKSKQKQHLYKIGDRVLGSKLTKIQRDRVTFSVDGREETLKRTDATEAPILPDQAPSSPVSASSGIVNVNRKEMHASLKDMGNMLSQAQLRPYFNAGKPDGFLLSNVKEGSVYQKLSLKNGDIIQGVNNRRMQSADDVVEFYNNLKSGTRMALQINRQGKVETIDYNFQ